MTDERRHSRGTTDAVVFVVGLSLAGAVLLLLTIPLTLALLAIVGIALITVRMVKDIYGNRAM